MLFKVTLSFKKEPEFQTLVNASTKDEATHLVRVEARNLGWTATPSKVKCVAV